MRFNLIFLLWLMPAIAGAGDFPDAQAVKQAQSMSHQKMKDFEQAEVPVPSFPKISITPRTDKKSLEELFKKAKHFNPKSIKRDEEKLLVFASFSMPEASLKKLIEQTVQAGGTVLMRGLVVGKDGKLSFRATQKKVASMQLKKNEGFAIDPRPFQTHHIQKVPAFLIENTDIDTVYGDVSLDYALRYMQKHSPQQSKPMIQSFLSKLEHQGFYR